MPDRLFGLVEREVGRRGGGRAELYVCRRRVRRFDARDGGIDSLSFSDTLALGVRVFRDGRMGFSYGFRGDEAGIGRMVEAAVFCADASDPDPAYGLPSAGECGEGKDGGYPSLPLYDPSCETAGDDARAGFARELERLTMSHDPRIRRVRAATLRETVEEVDFRNSDGRAGTRCDSSYHASVDAVAEEGGEGQTGYGFAFARRLADLDPGRIAAEGAGRALRMLGARPLATGRYPAIVENGAVADLLEVLVPSFLATQVAKGKSMLAGKEGLAVASPPVDIADDPLDPLGSAACGFDGEGVPSRRNILVEGGVLKGFLADVFWGRKIGTGSTASCRRPNSKTPPGVGISNLSLSPGARTPDAMRREAGSGIVLAEFLGIHTADPVSGDFSVGAAGYRFDGGEEREPVRGFAVSGNVLALLAAVVEAGSDFRWFGNVGAPSLLVSGLEVGGE